MVFRRTAVTATNAIGTSTASAASNSVTPEPFSCGDALIDGRNNQSYTTVEIGGQCWMAENLNIGTQINSADGGTNSDGQQTDNNILEKYCVYNDESNCDAYGGLYQWDEIMQYVTTEGTQGICPIGWHLPTDDEWKTMEMELGMTQEQADLEEIYRGTDQGGKMKSTSGWDDFGSPSEDGNGTNTSGFTALPGGDCAHGSSLFLNSGNTGYFWSSSEKSDIESWARRLISASDGVYRYGREKEYGFSVRCLKD